MLTAVSCPAIGFLLKLCSSLEEASFSRDTAISSLQAIGLLSFVLSAVTHFLFFVPRGESGVLSTCQVWLPGLVPAFKADGPNCPAMPRALLSLVSGQHLTDNLSRARPEAFVQRSGLAQRFSRGICILESRDQSTGRQDGSSWP